MNKKLLWAGVLGLASVIVGLVPSVMPVTVQAGEVWPNVVGIVRMALWIPAYALMALSDVKCARWIYVVIAFAVLSVSLSAARLIGLSFIPRSFSPIFGLVNSVAVLAVWVVLACKNAGRLRMVFSAWSAAVTLGLAMSIVFYVQSASQGGVLYAGWPVTALRTVDLLRLLTAYFAWLYLIYAAQPEDSCMPSEPRRVAWPWRVFFVTLPFVSLLGLGQGRNLLVALIAPIGMTFGVGGPLLGGIVGWGAYLALGVFILRARRLSSLLSLLGVFVVLVILNIVGCGALIGGSWK